ncbi:ferritin-like domain-containing protein [Candidatus Parcubacteria bacterium]|nr:ferritin-like domain-containing protein [Candidatus Parcubacteria bacterium]
MAKTNLLISWLNDAYAMEQAQIKMLERFIKDFDEFPEIQSGLNQHLKDTRLQIEDVESCLESLGEKTSAVKSGFSQAMGALEGISTGLYKDEAVKNMLMLHAGEHFEHAAYSALAAGAEACDEKTISEVCERIAAQEEEMADWLLEQLDEVAATTVEQNYTVSRT